ncbi:hemolysin family protein [Bacillus sp. B15-48]|uniref:hemolysin family protein n=1 Tax=Bacillus sp. B15-48 TaxID=1548601 RepID=UPI00193EF5EE|nr:hemolysin family protein [Bacillus sp. B15-48]MBM4765207.1 DUF21 domain-containing protein [Bacillus sp. B15-48]
MEISIFVLLLVMNAFFAGAEMAFISVNDNKIKQMADNGDKKAKLVHQLLKEPRNFLATIQIGITLTSLLASAFAAITFADDVTNFLATFDLPIMERLLHTISIILIILVLSYFILVFGELIPKRIALKKAEKIVFMTVTSLVWLTRWTAPFVKLLNITTNGFLKLFRIDSRTEEENVTEEEIRMMVDAGQEKGTILKTEKEMINNIFEFDNKTVSDIMTHRTNIVAIPADFSFKETIHYVNIEKYTRFPVYEDSMDHIIGILHVKDLIQFLESGDRNAFSLKEMVRVPHYVLESSPIDHLFREMQKNNIHLAIAIDEYGGVDGIVTIEDLIEEIVGKIFDEYDEPEKEIADIKIIDPFTYVMEGTTNLYVVEEVLGIELPIEDYDTLSGFIIGELGYIPDTAERPVLEYNHFIFAIEEMANKRIIRVKVTEQIIFEEVDKM